MKNSTENISINKLELDRFEEDKAVLFTDDNKEIILPKNLLPKSVEEGDNLVITIATDEAHTHQKEQKAKDLLNEILKIE